MIGKRNCNLSKDWEVTIWLSDGNSTTPIEQVTYEEALEFYVNLIDMLNDKTSTIKYSKKMDDEDTYEYHIIKSNIVMIKLGK